MYTARTIFEEVTVHGVDQAADALQALTDYIGQLQHMTGLWELKLYRLRLEADGEAVEITDLRRLASDKPLVWDTDSKPYTGLLWDNDAPMMQLLKQASGGTDLCLLADFSVTADEAIGYGTAYWREFFRRCDTPALRRAVGYRCMESESTELDVYPVSYDDRGFNEVPFTATKEDAAQVPMWVSQNLLIIRDLGDGADPEQAAADLQAIRQQYLTEAGAVQSKDGELYRSGRAQLTARDLEQLFAEARARSLWIEATFVPDRRGGNDSFAAVHIGPRTWRRDAWPYSDGVEYCMF